MTTYSLSLLESQHDDVRRQLFVDGNERGALLLCGRSRYTDPWTREVEERLVVNRVIEVPEAAYSSRTPISMTWSTTPFFEALKLAEKKDMAVVVIHSHPTGPLEFSPADDVADRETFDIAFNRLDSDRPHASLIMDRSGDMVGRAFGPDLKPVPLRMIRSLGKRWRFWTSTSSSNAAPAELDRQARAFGSESIRTIQGLRIGIVGCGGTGSAVATLISRMGARRIALFDTDVVDETNLNRLHFASRTDANLLTLKVEAVALGIASIGLATQIIRIPFAVDTLGARDAIRACDIVFGCTDDHLGRNFLNRLAHFYLIPVTDLGLLIEPNAAGSYDVFDGRVTVVQPGSPCQVCRGLIDADEMLAEGLRRNDPELYERRRRAGYVRGSPDPSPVVVTFTTEVATMAVNELFQRLIGFRGAMGHSSERVRRFDEVREADTLPAGKSRPGCKLCDSRRYDGRGDMKPFLDQSE
jgi:molybdopterin/thiamine biosynthesis adenylyltransferase